VAGFDIDVRVEGFDAIEKFLNGWSASEVDKRMRKALGKGAAVLARGIRVAAPIGPTGNIRRAVRSRMLRNRPGLGPAAVAGVRRKRGARIVLKTAQGLRRQDWAPHAGLVQGGHRTRGGGHVRPNRFVNRGIAATQAAAEAAVEQELERDF